MSGRALFWGSVVLAVLVFGCGGEDSSTSAGTAASPSQSPPANIDEITDSLQRAGYDVEAIRGDGKPYPDDIISVRNGDLDAGTVVNVELYRDRRDAIEIANGYAALEFPVRIVGRLIFFGPSQAVLADVDLVLAASAD